MAIKDGWRVEPGKTACLTIDLQAAYLEQGGPRECLAGLAIIPGVNELTELCRSLKIPVIHIRNYFRPDLSDIGLLPEIRPQTNSELEANIGLPGCEFYKGLVVKPQDYIVSKIRFSAFIAGSSNLEPLLRGLGCSTLLVCGMLTDACLMFTVANAMMLNFRVIVVKDLTATSTEERQQAGLRLLDFYFARLATLDQVKNEMKSLGG